MEKSRGEQRTAEERAEQRRREQSRLEETRADQRRREQTRSEESRAGSPLRLTGLEVRMTEGTA